MGEGTIVHARILAAFAALAVWLAAASAGATPVLVLYDLGESTFTLSERQQDTVDDLSGTLSLAFETDENGGILTGAGSVALVSLDLVATLNDVRARGLNRLNGTLIFSLTEEVVLGSLGADGELVTEELALALHVTGTLTCEPSNPGGGPGGPGGQDCGIGDLLLGTTDVDGATLGTLATLSLATGASFDPALAHTLAGVLGVSRPLPGDFDLVGAEISRTAPPASVPEPRAVLMMGMGLVGLTVAGRRRGSRG
jgi:hypothetical protein